MPYQEAMGAVGSQRPSNVAEDSSDSDAVGHEAEEHEAEEQFQEAFQVEEGGNRQVARVAPSPSPSSSSSHSLEDSEVHAFLASADNPDNKQRWPAFTPLPRKLFDEFEAKSGRKVQSSSDDSADPRYGTRSQPEGEEMPSKFDDSSSDSASSEDDSTGSEGELIRVNSDGETVANDEGAIGQDNDEFPQSQAMCKQFQEYIDHALLNFGTLKKKHVRAIKIFHTLIKKRATLDTYDAVMEWHFRDIGTLANYQTLGDTKEYWSRKTMMPFLKNRYFMVDKYAKPVTKVLRGNKAKVTLQLRCAKQMMASIITDPRWKDTDWLWHNKNPFELAETNLNYALDINTGKAYLATHRKLITDPTKQILVPIPLYIDGAVTGQFDKLEVEALKMTCGLHSTKPLLKPHS